MRTHARRRSRRRRPRSPSRRSSEPVGPEIRAEARRRRGAVDLRGSDVAAAQLHRGGRARRAHLRGGRDGGGDRALPLGLPALRPEAEPLDDAPAAARPDPRRGGSRARREGLRLRRADRRRRHEARPRLRRRQGRVGRPGAASAPALQRGRGRAGREDLRPRRLQRRRGAARASTSTTRRRTPGRSRTPMPIPNHTFGAVVFEGGIWTFGGRRGEEILRDVWIFDPATGSGRPAPRCRSRWS